MKYAGNAGLEILYEDRHLLALCKPADLPTQATEHSRGDLESYAKKLLASRLEEGRNPYVYAVHRIDAPVTGIVLFAKSSKALSRMQDAIRSRVTRKRYLAYVDKKPANESGVLEHTLLHGDHRAHVLSKGHAGGQLSKLEYRLLGRAGPYFLLAVYPHTGRYHQIRVQLAEIGCPILGDIKYGAARWGLPGIALHSHTLEFDHPVGSSPIQIIASPPCYWPHKDSIERYLRIEQNREL